VSAGAATAFDRATTARPDGQGALTVTLDPAWDAPAGRNGGDLAAMPAELADPARPPRSRTLHVLRRGGPGRQLALARPARGGGGGAAPGGRAGTGGGAAPGGGAAAGGAPSP